MAALIFHKIIALDGRFAAIRQMQPYHVPSNIIAICNVFDFRLNDGKAKCENPPPGYIRIAFHAGVPDQS
ncbi:MAG TPA: hypothetical protein ACFCUC_14700 [Desulfobacterales bacterium]